MNFDSFFPYIELIIGVLVIVWGFYRYNVVHERAKNAILPMVIYLIAGIMFIVFGISTIFF